MAQPSLLRALDKSKQEISIPLGEGYETVAASQTGQALGATGAAGDFIAGILVVPATAGASIVIDPDVAPLSFTGIRQYSMCCQTGR